MSVKVRTTVQPLSEEIPTSGVEFMLPKEFQLTTVDEKKKKERKNKGKISKDIFVTTTLITASRIHK